MTGVRLTGECDIRALPDVLRALYGVLHPEVAGTIETMPHLAFVPENADGIVRNGGEEGISIKSESPPIVTRINTNNMGWLLGFEPRQFVDMVSFLLGHAHVYFTRVNDNVVLTVGYESREAHAAEQDRVSAAVGHLLEKLEVR